MLGFLNFSVVYIFLAMAISTLPIFAPIYKELKVVFVQLVNLRRSRLEVGYVNVAQSISISFIYSLEKRCYTDTKTVDC